MLELARRGKYLIVRFESGRSLLIHLRMTGTLRVLRGEEPAEGLHDRAVVSLDDGSGIVCVRKRGDRVAAGDVVAEIHARDEESADAVEGAVLAAFDVGDAPSPRRVVLDLLS